MNLSVRVAILPAVLAALGAAAAGAQDGAPKTVPGFDPAAIDRAADPCQNFYQFACGGWLAQNPVRADRARYGRFDELQERNQATLHEILEKAAAAKNAPGGIDQKIGDYYASCMDEAAIEKKGAAVLKPHFDLIAGMKSTSDLTPV